MTNASSWRWLCAEWELRADFGARDPRDVVLGQLENTAAGNIVPAAVNDRLPKAFAPTHSTTSLALALTATSMPEDARTMRISRPGSLGIATQKRTGVAHADDVLALFALAILSHSGREAGGGRSRPRSRAPARNCCVSMRRPRIAGACVADARVGGYGAATVGDHGDGRRNGALRRRPAPASKTVARHPPTKAASPSCAASNGSRARPAASR